MSKCCVYLESLHCVTAKVLDCGLEVSEFELQSCCYVHFQTNTFGKAMNPLVYGLNNINAVFLQG